MLGPRAEIGGWRRLAGEPICGGCDGRLPWRVGRRRVYTFGRHRAPAISWYRRVRPRQEPRAEQATSVGVKVRVRGEDMDRSDEQRSAPVEAARRAGEAIIGWREWVGLPELRLPLIKAKVDTGARTSTLHAFYVEAFRCGGEAFVRFGVHPLRGRSDVEVHCEAQILDRRVVSDSGGHKEQRYVIRTPLEVGGRTWPIEVTLTNREDMLFRMLLGRTAIAGRGVVDPLRSFVSGRQRHAAAAYRASRPDAGG